MAGGDLAAARAAYQAYQDIAERLAAADPANTEWQRNLSISHIKLGDVWSVPAFLDTELGCQLTEFLIP